MPAAVRMREDYSAEALRSLAKRSKDANQSRRLLSLAAVRDACVEAADDTSPRHSSGMTPHISGTSQSAQARYAAGTREILECFFERRPIRDEYLIVDSGKPAGVGAHSYTAGDATRGSEEAAKFKSLHRQSA